METLFRKTLGNSPQLRVLELFIEARELYYSFEDIKEETNISPINLSKLLQYWKKAEIIISIKTVDNMVLYNLNLKNPIAKRMVEAFDEIIK